jgi:DNA-binding beta-propeller fold protein YncE
LSVAGFGFRFWDLGARALHHDESLHGYISYVLLRDGTYLHEPALHGPFQFFGTALSFFVTGGAGDYTVRVLPALFGTVLVALPLLFRSHLGRLGALLAGAFIAFSPTLLYYSRFARNDIYMAVFTLGLVIALWRYVEERKQRYLYAAAGLLGLSFATKETAFITAAILLIFLNLWLAADLTRRVRDRLGLNARTTALVCGGIFLPFAWAIAAAWPLLGGLRDRLGLGERPPAADLLVILGTLSAPQFAAAIQVPIEAISGSELDTPAEQRWLGIPTVSLLLASTAIVGLGWNRRAWPLAAAFFYVPYALLFTSFLTNLEGFGSGIWESLDYWIDQHPARRGGQPDFYYLMFLPAYEFVALALAGPALLYYTLRGGLRSWTLTSAAVFGLLMFFGADSVSPALGDIRVAGGILDGIPLVGDDIAGLKTGDVAKLTLPVAAVALFFAVKGSMFERFLVFWTAASLVAYSWMGERMPWLSVHTTLPAVVLAAYAGRGIVSSGVGIATPRGATAYVRPAAAAGFAGLAAGLAAFGPSDGTMGALRLAGIALALVVLAALLIPLGRRRLALLATAVVVGALAVFSVRVAVLTSFDHGDVAREFLFYVQTTPETPDVVEQVNHVAATSGLGRDLRVQVDRTYTWPWGWYLREYDATFPGFGGGFEPEPGAVVLADSRSSFVMEPFLENYQEPVRFRLRNWFPEDYRDIGRGNVFEAIRDFAKDLGDRDTWRTWWDFWLDRDATPISLEAIAYVPREFGQTTLVRTPTPIDETPVDLEGRFIIGREGSEPGGLANPLGMALDGEGNLYVVDSGNDRIQKFDPAGRFLAAAGEPGSEPGQFNQPTGLALDVEGNLYVADTWNHRIQKFDSELEFVTAWGEPTDDLINPGPLQMWGPRSVAVDAEGNVWVADTGTHRVRKFDASGTPIAAFGSRGEEPGLFQEPVGIAVGEDGSIYVADPGNARLQKFDSEFEFLEEFTLSRWADRDPRNKPYLWALPDGRLLASDGPHGRVLLIDQEGEVVASLEAVSDVPLLFPSTVAFDENGRFVYVTDAVAGHIRRLPFTDFALP